MAKRYAKAIGAAALTDITDAAAVAGTYFLSICNREAADRTFRVAITDGAAVTTADYLHYDTTIEGNGWFGMHPLVLAAGWKVFVYGSGTGLTAMLVGREE